MYINYLKVILRNLSREKGYALINIAGLTVGIASCILILLLISNELSYDRYHKNADKIFRVGIEALFGDSNINSVLTSGAMKEVLDNEFSEIEEACRLIYVTRPLVKVDNRSFVEEDFFYTDSNFFDVFSVTLLKGDPGTVLSRPNTVVISEDAANKLFGDGNPVGKMLRVNDHHELEITGVSKNMSYNSHFRFDFLGSIATISRENQESWRYWTTNILYTYILLGENILRTDIEDKMQDLVYKYVGPEVETVGINIESFETGGGTYRFFLEALPDIHLHSKADNQLNPGGSVTYIYFFSIIAIFLLLIACINFMNMATARFANRAKEVGIRKVVGSTRGQLMQQFLAESVLISLVAIIFAITLVELVLPFFNFLTSKNLIISYTTNWYVLPSILLFAVFVGLLAGSYPAFFLSSFQPVKVLKGEVNSGIKSNKLRKVLVVVQFSITIALLIGTFIVSEQLEYWQSRDQGYNREGLVILKRTHILYDQQKTFREELINNEYIINASFCSSIPGYSFGATSIYKYGSPSEDLVQSGLIMADDNYFKTMGIELTEGRFFSHEYGTDSETIVINETFMRVMGLQNPTEESIVFPNINMTSPIIGVFKNVNFESLHRNIRPMIIRKLEDPGWLMVIRVKNENMPAVMYSIENSWTSFAGDAPFIYSFLENDLLELYNQEIRTRRIFTIFSLLAIFIACLGLLGMASFTAEKRTKEIGIRKAMGASLISIYTLLTREVVVLVLYAALFAWPVAWFVMTRWLENFSYRIHPGVATFIISTLISLVIALLTISYQARKAATANPVDSLKYE